MSDLAVPPEAAKPETSPATTAGLDASPPKTPKEKSSADSGAGIKETIESILVAFILAFIFRAFVVEAFVIPTGSMAPTLLGAHMHFRCPDCGYEWDVNYSGGGDDDSSLPSEAKPSASIYCPNCGNLVAGPNDDKGTPVQFGDRILVLKYSYLLHPPQRWDVVVFKSPYDPEKNHYTQNFIKRLTGLPGESLMVLDGDLYVNTGDVNNDNGWEIQSKPWNVQQALWRVIYDNDFYPQLKNRSKGTDPWKQPWQQIAGKGWDTGKDAVTGREFHFNNPAGTGQLQFKPVNTTSHTLTDYLVYDVNPPNSAPHRSPEPFAAQADLDASPVTDLKLVANYKRESGDGPLKLVLSRHTDVTHFFSAQITADSVQLTDQTSTTTGNITIKNAGLKKLADLGIKPNQPIFIEFTNVDYQVTLRLNGKAVFEPYNYPPNVSWLMEHMDYRHPPGDAEIDATNQTCSLEHISLWRDVFYTNNERMNHQGTPHNPVTLGKGEYFVLGDNSPISADARAWIQPIDLPNEDLKMKEGRVPEQFLLGQAVFVYWPAGFPAYGYSIIPDFGDMRWIH